MTEPPASFYRARWIRECLHWRRLSRATALPEAKRKLRAQARQALRNAREWQGRVERECI